MAELTLLLLILAAIGLGGYLVALFFLAGRDYLREKREWHAAVCLLTATVILVANGSFVVHALSELFGG